MIIWLASYPRSGNTFVRTVLNHAFDVGTYSIYGDKIGIGADRRTTEIVGHMELPADFCYDEARFSKKLFVIKTHEPYNMRKHGQDKAIYVYRDGREATVSYYHHNQDFSKTNPSYLQIINGHNDIGTWSDHYLSWLQMKTENCLFLKFEEIILNPKIAIKNIAFFAHLTIKSNEIPGFEDLKKVNPKFFRSGKTDSFLDELSVFEQEYFWLCNGRGMRMAGYLDREPNLENTKHKDELLFLHIQLTLNKATDHLNKKLNHLSQQVKTLKQNQTYTDNNKNSKGFINKLKNIFIQGRN
jgi:hypothetical protein